MQKKLKPIEIQASSSLSDILDICHDVFKKTIANKNRPSLDEREIYIPLVWIENKAELFWHIASLEQNTKQQILPCNNDPASAICHSNCLDGTDDILLSNGEERSKCIYRATRVGWIRTVIDMFNESDPRVKYWEKLNSNKKNRIYLRYQEDENDYLVVFEEKSKKRVALITGFPVFFVSAKSDYDKDYNRYQKILETKKPVITM